MKETKQESAYFHYVDGVPIAVIKRDEKLKVPVVYGMVSMNEEEIAELLTEKKPQVEIPCNRKSMNTMGMACPCPKCRVEIVGKLGELLTDNK